MISERDWLFRPVLAGMILATSLYDGSINLAKIADMNDALDVQEENTRLARKARPEQG